MFCQFEERNIIIQYQYTHFILTALKDAITKIIHKIIQSSGVRSQNIWGHNLSEGAQRPSGGRVWAFPPPTVGSFFIFRLENVQSGAYLRRKFWLDVFWRHVLRVTIRPTGKRGFFFFFHELGNIIMKIIYAPQYNLRKISNTCQRYTQT